MNALEFCCVVVLGAAALLSYLVLALWLLDRLAWAKRR